MSDFLHMGGDAGFIFGSYAVVVLALIFGRWSAHRAERKLRDRLRGQQP